MARCGEISLTRLPRATAPRVQQGGHTPAATGRSLPDASSDRRSRQRRLLGLGHPLLGHSVPPRSLCNAKSANEASPRQPGSSIRRRRGIFSACASLAHPPWLRTPDLQGRRARRMPWESFAVGGPDEAREFWMAAVSDARALPPGGRDGLGGRCRCPCASSSGDGGSFSRAGRSAALRPARVYTAAPRG